MYSRKPFAQPRFLRDASMWDNIRTDVNQGISVWVGASCENAVLEEESSAFEHQAEENSPLLCLSPASACAHLQHSRLLDNRSTLRFRWCGNRSPLRFRWCGKRSPLRFRWCENCCVLLPTTLLDQFFQTLNLHITHRNLVFQALTAALQCCKLFAEDQVIACKLVAAPASDASSEACPSHISRNSCPMPESLRSANSTTQYSTNSSKRQARQMLADTRTAETIAIERRPGGNHPDRHASSSDACDRS